MARKFSPFLVLLVAALVAVSAISYASTAAQDGPTVVATGLNSPRALFYDAEGTLYIVEAGEGGSTDSGSAGPDGLPRNSGGTGRVTTLAADGTQGTLLNDLPSNSSPAFEAAGPSQIHVSETSVWLLSNGGPLYQPMSFSIVELDRATTRVKRLIDLFTFEATNNPDGQAIDSNPVDFVATEDGTLYIADAGCNCVLKWTAEAGLETLIVWDTNPVPTGIDLGPDGNLYISFLTGFPFPEGGAKIEVRDTAGTLVTEYGGLTMAVNVEVADDGTIYAVELGRFDLAAAASGSPWVANSGRVVRVSEEGITPVAENLNFPYGLLQNPDGDWLVTVNSAFSAPGTGEVWLLEAE